MEFIRRLFDPSGFPARWECGSGWAETPWLGWLHVFSDLGVWSAYVAIPLVLIYFLLRRRDLPFRMIFLLFGAFILACGTTHLMDAVIFWWPVYRLAALIKLFTAIVSWATVFSLFSVVPAVLTMRSPEELQKEIEARMHAEEKLQQANLDLEQRVQDRTAELKEADRRKDEFLATLAHELRNPLAPISSSLEVMKRASSNPELIEASRNTMERQLFHLVRLVDDLLDVSRINRNKLELRRQTVELASIIHHAVEAVLPLVKTAGHELITSLPPEQIYLDADPIRLAQVIENLLVNACKYTKRGGRIWLKVKQLDGWVVIKVKDTGIGIPPNQLDRVFNMFTQIDRTAEPSQSGLGIGLMLVKRIVELHQGNVTASSKGKDQGSEFVVTLPTIEKETRSHIRSEASTGCDQVIGRRILIVDDNQDAATTLTTLFKLSGNEVETAFEGMEAIAKAETFNPEVILLDIGLPKLNGYAVCQTIRSHSWGKDMIIVALTGWGQEGDRRQSRDAGFDGHLVKPVDHASLIKLLMELNRN